MFEAISKIGFWFKIEAGQSFKPQATCGFSGIQNEAPTKISGPKTFLSWLLITFPMGPSMCDDSGFT
jgi:hypothetical protein